MQFGINKHEQIFKRLTKLHEPVGWVQFVIFENFIPNCTRKIMWLLINNLYMKKFRDGWAEGTHAYHAIREKLRHQLRQPGRSLDLKTKDLIGHLWVSLIIDQSECTVCFLFLHWINSFLHRLKKKTVLPLTNQNGEIFSCILLLLKNESNDLIYYPPKKIIVWLSLFVFFEPFFYPIKFPFRLPGFSIPYDYLRLPVLCRIFFLWFPVYNCSVSFLSECKKGCRS